MTNATAAGTSPPGPYHVRPPSQTSGWGTCDSAEHEIVARTHGRDRAQVQAIARLLRATLAPGEDRRSLMAPSDPRDRLSGAPQEARPADRPPSVPPTLRLLRPPPSGLEVSW